MSVGGSRVLLMRPTAIGKKLFLWRELLVLMDLSLLPEGRDSKEFVFRGGSWRLSQGPGGTYRLQPITFSAFRHRLAKHVL